MREHWNRHYAAREPPSAADAHVRLLEESVALTPGRALDLACGSGRNAVWLAQRGWQVTGVDLSDAAIAQARALAAACGVECAWAIADLLELELEPDAYELVLVFFLHLPPAQRDAVLAKAAAAVAPGGTFLLAAHDRLNLSEGHHGPSDPELLFSAEDVLPHLAGFEIERAGRERRAIETPAGEGVMVDALVRAHRPAAEPA